MRPTDEPEKSGPYTAWWNSLTPESHAAHNARRADQEKARVAGVSVEELWRRRKAEAAGGLASVVAAQRAYPGTTTERAD